MDWRNPDGFPPALNTILRRHKDDVDGIAAAVELSALLTRHEAMRAALEGAMDAALKAVDDEAELPGPMPEGVRSACGIAPESKHAAEMIIRDIVVATKRGIRLRIQSWFESELESARALLSDLAAHDAEAT